MVVLKTQIEWLRRQLFGGGKSEKLDRAQLLLKLGELEKLAATVRSTETISYERARPAPETRSTGINECLLVITTWRD